MTKEIKIQKKFAYKVTEEVIKSLDSRIHPPLDSNPKENNKKQLNKMPNKTRQNNLFLMDPDAKELMLTVPLRYKNSFYFSYLPDPVTLFLNLSHESLQKIVKLEVWLESEYKAGTFVWLTNENNFHQKKFGDIISCIVLLIMAVEALANELLPEHATISGKEFSKEQLEVNLSLEEKFKVLRNKGISIEQELFDAVIYLKKLRDDIVHFKSFSQDLNKVKSVYPFDTILNLDMHRYFHKASELINSLSPGRVQYVDEEAT